MLFTDSMTIGDKLLNGLGITVLGMGVVFVVLIILSYALDLLRIIAGDSNKKKAPANEEVAQANHITNTTQDVQEEDDEEIIAVISAAIASFTGTSVENFFIQSIKPVPQKNTIWGAVGRQERMLDRL